MSGKVGLASTCLHISAALYLIVAVACLALIGYDPTVSFEIGVVCLFSVALAVGIEIVAYGVRRRKFWAWVAGLCTFGLYVPSLFLPLGALGLWGLLNAGSRREFGVDK